MSKILSGTRILLLSLMTFCGVVMADQEVYRIDSTHSFANWIIRHVASKTSGTFSEIKGKVVIDPNNLASGSVNASINVLSVNSSHAKRDENIKKEAYLDAYKFSDMTFVSHKIEAKTNVDGVMFGALTIHGITNEISFPFKVLGFGTDPWGGQRVGFEGHTTLKASDFGFKWSLSPTAPIGNDIEITLLIEGVKLPTETVFK